MTGIVGNDVGVPPSGSGHSAEPEPSSTVSAVPVSVPNAVYVLIGSSGEYSDRYERVIGFVLTEEEAEAAVKRAEYEKGLPDPIPYPEHESEYAYQLPDGTWFEGYILDAPKDSVFREKPNAAEIKARGEAGRAAWRQARVDAGRIDPDGSMESYYFEIAPAIAMEARQGGDGETRLHPKDDSAGLQGIARKVDHD